MKKKNQQKTDSEDWGYDLHVLLHGFAKEKRLDTAEMLGYLTATISGTFAMNGYGEVFVKKTLDRMFDEYLRKKKELDEKPDYLFSEALRSRLHKFGDMPIDEMLQSQDFWHELVKHAGCENDPKMIEIMNRKPDVNATPQSRDEFMAGLEKIMEDAMPELLKAFEEMKEQEK